MTSIEQLANSNWAENKGNDDDYYLNVREGNVAGWRKKAYIQFGGRSSMYPERNWHSINKWNRSALTN